MQLEFINCILCIIAVQGTCFTQFMYFFMHQSLNFHISVSQLPDDVGASPIDIARAYMPSSPSPSPKSSTCWPGATVQYQRGFMTPQSQRERFGPHIFPRTPYSRTSYSKSMSQACEHDIISLSAVSNSRYGQVNSRGKTVYDGHGSV
ncbi:hypothetical protein NC652_015921 [Populus alba x Populus x berolinensis]|nr:hypothetical protein NC652_015921 [Populus alba x Populus x berolinensis]